VEVTREVLDGLEAEILKVKLEYDLFFQGTRQTEPIEEKRRLDESIRRIGQRRIINTLDQFRFNGIQSRYYSYCNLWMRTVRDLEEGRMTRDPAGSLAPPPRSPEEPVAGDHLDRIVEELCAARTLCGIPPGESDVNALKETLRARAREIASKAGAGKVEFKVSVEGGKPKLKAVVRPAG